MSGKKNHKEKETLEKRGTKKYQQRLAETKEAEQMIRRAKLVDEDIVVEPFKLTLDYDGV